MAENNKQQRQTTATAPQERHTQPIATAAPPRGRPNMARGIRLPGMQPRRADPPPQHGEVYDDEDADPGVHRQPVRQRMEGRHPVRGIGAPQAIEQREVVQSANQLLEAYQRDPEMVDPTFVNLMALQALCSYGGEVQGLRHEIARLRKEVEAYRTSGEPEAEAPRGGTRNVRVSRLQRGRNRAAKPSGLRGRRTG